MDHVADAKEILRQLNDRGYKNITPEQLKEFIKNLKTLIKFDTAASTRFPPSNSTNLHYRQSTSTSEAKVNTKSITPPCNLKSNMQCNENQQVENHYHRRKALSETSNSRSSSANNKITKMWIRPNSKTGQNKKSDPVQLYHAYQSDWERFKENIPIDNKHLDLRWQIRNKTHKN